VTRTLAPAVEWVTGSPFWGMTGSAGGDSAVRGRPALLRFGSDTFMDDLAAVLETRPSRLREHLARPRSFRPAPPGVPDGWQPSPGRLKLYQPFHGDFNLVAASLVCRMPGMPDHTVRTAKAERVAFVLRRLQAAPDGTTVELAWVPDPGGTGRRWLPLEPVRAGAIAAGEELFPMFPVAYQDGPQPRRLLVGLVPVASGETFRSAARLEPFPPRPEAAGGPPGVPEADPRRDEFDTRVIGPLAAICDPRPLKLSTAQLEDASAMLLVDLADLLDRHLPSVWRALQPDGAPPAEPAAARLYRTLQAKADRERKLDWPEALVAAWKERMAIFGEAGTAATLRCNLRQSDVVVRRKVQGDGPEDDSLQGAIRAALGTRPPGQSQGTPPDLAVPKLEPTGQATYWVRCLYRRPQCQPLPIDLVSRPSEPFAIAPVLDPDAPARPVRISLPVDTGVKDLRKFRKNVGFVLSNQLRSQMDRVTDLKKALDGDLGEEVAWDLGVICQFSIPIITIVALVVLMIFLILLNIVFFWLPFFRICLPVPVRSGR
jgi:hypothetical protein